MPNMALQYTFQFFSILNGVVIIKYNIHKITSIQHPMWQFAKALRPSLCGEDDVCTITSNSIRSIFVVFTVAT